MAKPIVATTWCYFPPEGVLNMEGRKACLINHIKESFLKRQFKKMARIYFELHHSHVWTEDVNGKILYDTDRGDHSAEVESVRNTPKDKLFLLVGKIKTDLGTRELHKRIGATV